MPGFDKQTVPPLDLSALTYADFLVAAAEEFGFGQTDSSGVAIPPTDAGELARCRKVVLRGLRRFALSNPVGWRFTRQTYSMLFDVAGTGPLNVGSDAAVYRMPWWFNGNPIGDWTSLDQGYRIRVVDQAYLYGNKAATFGQSTGIPRICCFRKAAQDKPTNQGLSRWVVEFWPAPTVAETVTIEAEAWLDGMQNEDDVFVAGQPFDRAVERCIIAEAAHDSRKGSERIGETEQAYGQALAEAMAFENRRPALIGRLAAVGDNDTRADSVLRPRSITFGQYTLE